jgi:hypothetical protein
MAPRGPIYLILSMGLFLCGSTVLGQEKGVDISEPPCGYRALMIEALKEVGESSIGVGEIGTEGKYAYELTVDPKTGNWTIMLTDLRGISCLVAAGTKWRSR